jgi:hypothetical protein
MTFQFADYPDPRPQEQPAEQAIPDPIALTREWPEMAEQALSPYNMDCAAPGHVPGWSLE